ncbi:MAG: endolytic transglycosylase MltG, partial [Rhizobiales bacterium]|nr:endolytic transglycosylase MltG [Hyphomicrobiales bacterium]
MSDPEQHEQDYDLGRVPDPVMPRKRRSVFSRVFSSLFLLGIAALVVGAIAAFIGYQEFTAPGPLAEKKIYEIGRGLDTRGIAQKLQDEGIISDARIFTAAAYLGNVLGGKLKAGEYEFPAAASMDEVLGIVASGRAITYKVTIPEGWTSEMAVARLRENEVLAGEIVTVPAEGVIRPDTYVFKRGMTRQKLLEDMELAQKQLIEELWKNRAPSDLIKSKEDAIVLASIVEKETGRAEERAEVAAVFMNRLRRGMKLQSDPTIIYGIAGGKGRLDRPITKADISTPTPYNTYTIDGLPPGPIGNPGAAALEAVLNPASSNNLYFVADGTGGHAFAETLEQHNANVAKWRAI